MDIDIYSDADTNTDIDIDTYIYTHIYTSLTILIASENYTEVNKSIAGWLNSLLVSIPNHMLCMC